MVQSEYDKIKELRQNNRGKEIEIYAKQTSDLVKEVAGYLMKFCERSNIDPQTTEEIVECIKDTSMIEGICAANGDFTHIEDYILASKNQVFSLYKTMLDPSMNYDTQKALDYIRTPNSGGEENRDEIMRWFRMIAQYLASGTDNENEQLSKGGNKRKNNN